LLLSQPDFQFIFRQLALPRPANPQSIDQGEQFIPATIFLFLASSGATPA
jgi:hypothetical protein